MPRKRTRKRGPRKKRPTDLQRQELWKKAYELRLQGSSYPDIADQLGVSSAGAVCNMVNRYLDRGVFLDTERARKTELARLDALFMTRYPHALRGDDKALEKCLKIMKFRCRLSGVLASTPLIVNHNQSVTAVKVETLDTDTTMGHRPPGEFLSRPQDLAQKEEEAKRVEAAREADTIEVEYQVQEIPDRAQIVADGSALTQYLAKLMPDIPESSESPD